MQPLISYGSNMHMLALGMFIAQFVWYSLLKSCESRPTACMVFKIANTVLALVAIYGVLSHTVFGRTVTDGHQFIVFFYHPGETFRECFMNTLLYFPLGLTLVCLMGRRAILVAFAMSLCIESWQYFAGTGTAQLTDLLCNTLGCSIGALPYVLWMHSAHVICGKNSK